MLKNQRCAMFVDVQNIFYGAQYEYKKMRSHHKKLRYEPKIDFAKLMHYCVGNRSLVRAICYIVVTDLKLQQNFISALKDIGYEIKTKQLIKRPDGSAKGNWDIGIAMDAIIISEVADVVILVSGDGDFASLVNYLKIAKGVKVEVSAFPNSTSQELKSVADEFIPLDEKYLLNYK
ncbi:MAG: NYN domain-containing protein [Candidatus Hydrogenedentota bacterium]